MDKATLNRNGIATKSGEIEVYNFDGDTYEYLTSSVEYLAVGVGIPANSCTDAPVKARSGFAICRKQDLTAWKYIADHRGKKVYSTETGEVVPITVLGNYPEDTTTLAPATPYDTWNGSEWLTDTKAQHAAYVESAEQQKTVLLAEAQATIGLWQSELLLNSISDEDKASLITWMKYIKSVKALNTSKAPKIKWPRAPAAG